MNTEELLKAKCNEIKELLLEKNRSYGDSALNPVNVFSNLSATEGIKIRIDDKLARIANRGLLDETEDTIKDLTGYFILLMIARDNDNNSIQRHKGHKQSVSHGSEHSSTTNTTGEVEINY